MIARPTILLTCLAALTLAGACRRQPLVQPAPATTQPAASTPAVTQPVAQPPAAVAPADRPAATPPDRSDQPSTSPADIARTRAELMQVLVEKVYFDYDKDELRDDARTSLDAKAAVLNANPAIALVVIGHTDERGTAEYNLALGQRRAAQVKRYLGSKGIADARVLTQSMGDSQPAAQGTDENAYSQNRRAEFEVQNAGSALVRPRS